MKHLCGSHNHERKRRRKKDIYGEVIVSTVPAENSVNLVPRNK